MMVARKTPGKDKEYTYTVGSRISAMCTLLTKHVPSMTIAQLSSFVTVAMYPDRNLKELQALTELPQATISRHMLDLGKYKRKRTGLGEERVREEGAGLVETVISPTSMRERNYRLTQRGKGLFHLLENIVVRPDLLKD